MMYKKQVSVIVPVYNAEQFLRCCLDSIIAQTFTDWECILVDDGSCDQSGAICDEYAANDSRFKVIHQENQGVSVARNQAMETCRGKWIAFVDSDDYIQPSYLMDILELAENIGPDSIVCSGFKRLRNKCLEDYSPEERIYRFPEDAEMWLKEVENGFVCSKLYFRKHIEDYRLRFKENVYLCEDSLFLIDYVRNLKSVKYHSSVAGYVYREDGGGAHSQVKSYLCELRAYEMFKQTINSFCYLFGINVPRTKHAACARLYRRCFLALASDKSIPFIKKILYVCSVSIRDRVMLGVYYDGERLSDKMFARLFCVSPLLSFLLLCLKMSFVKSK